MDNGIKKKKIRLIVTLDCHRDCTYCCNKYEKFKRRMTPIFFFELSEYDEIIITGGEPLLPTHIGKTLQIIRDIRKFYPSKKLYLYTTVWDVTAEFKEIMMLVDGIHYSLHAPLKDNDLLKFSLFQQTIKICGKGSYRAYIDPEIDQLVSFFPNLFVRVESKPWLMEHEIELPEDKLGVMAYNW